MSLGKGHALGPRAKWRQTCSLWLVGSDAGGACGRWRRLWLLPALQLRILVLASLILVPHGWGGDRGFGFTIFEGLVGKVQQPLPSAHACAGTHTHTHTHTHARTLPRSAVVWGSPASLWLLVPLRPRYSSTSGTGFCILHTSCLSVGPKPTYPLCVALARA